MDKRSILAVVLSVVILLGWQKFYLEPFQKAAQLQAEQQEKERLASLAKTKSLEAATPIADAKVSADVSVPVSAAKEIQSRELSAGKFNLGISNTPEVFNSWTLNSYYKALERSEGKIDLGLVTGFSKQLRLRFIDPNYTALNQTLWTPSQEKDGSFVSRIQAGGVEMQRSVSPSKDEYFVDLNYQFHFTAAPPAFVFFDLLGNPHRANDKEGSILGQTPDKVKFTYRDANQRKSIIAANLKETHETMAGVRWFGLDTRYFVFAVVPGMEWRKDSGIQISSGFEDGAPMVRGSLVIPTGGKKDLSVPLRIFFGPKLLENLQSSDPLLTDTIDFGWTSFIAIPILGALKWLHSYISNYGLAIILLTIGIKILLFPLMYKSMKSMSKMTKLQPQLNALREKFKDDKEKLNTEMMNFMKTHGYNPVSGCLPILAQMPIFFALYRVLFNSIELYQAPFGLWIHDLSLPDPFYVTPVLLCGLMFVQQKLSPNTAADPMQQKMMQFMPIMFGMFMLLLPAGLTIYMVVNSVMTISQQWFLNHKFGVYEAAKRNKAMKAAANPS